MRPGHHLDVPRGFAPFPLNPWEEGGANTAALSPCWGEPFWFPREVDFATCVAGWTGGAQPLAKLGHKSFAGRMPAPIDVCSVLLLCGLA